MGSSVLETFFIEFDSDSKNVKKGANDALKSTKELETSLASVDNLGAKAGESFVSLAKTAAVTLASIFAVGHTMSEVFEMANVNDDLGDFSESLNTNSTDVAAWGDALVHYGGNLESFKATLSNLTEQFAMVATTGHSRALPFFQKLGIAILDAHGKARNVMDVLPEIAKKIEGMDPNKSRGLLGRMGIDEKTIMLLQRGSREVAETLKRQKEIGEVTKEDTDIASKFNDEMDDMHHIFRTIYTAIGSTILPALTALVHGIISVYLSLREHKGFVIGAIMGMAGALIFLKREAILALLSPIGELIFAVRAFGLSMLWSSIQGWLLNAAVLALPLLIFGIIAAIALLVDDIWNWVAGNDSAIGKVLGTWADFKVSVTKHWAEIKESFSKMWDDMKLVAQEFLDWIFSKFAKLGELYDGVKGFFGLGDTNNSLTVGGQAIASANSTPLGAQTSNSIVGGASSSKSNTVKIGTVTVQTQATDAEGISKAIGGTLNDHLRNAQDQADDGIQ